MVCKESEEVNEKDIGNGKRASITHDVAWSAESVSQVTTDRSLDCNAKGLVGSVDAVG